MLRAGPVYFYDQQKSRPVKRSKKMPEELPPDMKFLNMNPRLANLINSLNRNKKGGTAHAEKKLIAHPKGEKMRKEKYMVLPEIGGSTLQKNIEDNSNCKNSQVSDEYLMNPFDDYKYCAPTLLYELEKLLYFFSKFEIIFPQGVVNVLNYSWQELTEAAIKTKKYCQTSKKMTSDTSMAPEENDCKAPRASTTPPGTADNTKRIKNKTNATFLEKAGHELAQSRPTGHRSPQSIAAHFSISFSMSSRMCEDKGWIFGTKNAKSEEMEWRSVIAWALERLQLAQIQINKQLSNLDEKGLNKPVILRYYDGTKKDPILKQKKSNKPPAFVLTNGKPHIPEIKLENLPFPKLHYSLIDGSSMVYYPTGKLAVCQSYSGLSFGGLYTNIFSPKDDILGTFTPFGHGSVFFPDSNCYVLHYNQIGGRMAEKEGDTIKEWDWPTKEKKIPDPITLQVNEFLSIKIAGQFAITLTYKWQHEVVRLTLSPLQDIPPPQAEDLGQFMTNEHFSSRTAKEMSRGTKKKTKEKDSKRSTKKTTILSELVKTLEIPEDHISASNDLIAATELRKLQRKIRNIAEDWMEHYRLASGLDSLHIQRMSDAPPKTSRKRKVKSATSFLVTTPVLKSPPVIETDSSHIHGRFLSAPAHAHNICWDTSRSASPRPSLSSSKKEHTADDPSFSKNASGLNIVSKSGPETAISVRVCSVEQESQKLQHVSHYTCPVVLQKVLLGEEGGMCRCSNHQIPHVTDLEFDQLINSKLLSSDQIIVTCVVSSLDAEEQHKPDVLDQLYEQKNRYRSMPCMQSRLDSFRLLKYDINTCNMYTGHKDPLLVQRHNVAPGMFLMYVCGKLMFANYIFNGYSRSIKDLQKQIVKTRSDYHTGTHLPSDFKFCQSDDIKALHLRTA